MPPAQSIFAVVGVTLLVLLWLRLADPLLWKQPLWKIGLKIAVGLLAVGLVLTLLYLLAPEFVFE